MTAPSPIRCSAETQYGTQCAREANNLINGIPYCHQHGRRIFDKRDLSTYIEREDQTLDEMEATTPQHGPRWGVRLLRVCFWGRRWSHLELIHCLVCGRLARTRRLITIPTNFRRRYVRTCKRSKCWEALRRWEGLADVRRQRAQYDWERQNPELASLAILGKMPPQYPSISRATLRSFLDSKAEVATVDGLGITALNGSIRSLGFADEVYAEIRSGQTVLRRVTRVDSAWDGGGDAS